MITEYDLQEAIAECEGQRNPTANTCLKLAAYYIIKDKMYPAEQEEVVMPKYSYAMSTDVVEPRSEFMEIVDGIDPSEYLAVMDELMSTVKALIPKLYDGVMRRLSEIN